MADQTDQQTDAGFFPSRAVYGVALVFVVLGILNSMPTIPGWDDMWRGLTGVENLKVRNFGAYPKSSPRPDR